MAIRFNAAEILEMAMEIERNGAAFYRKAAELKGKSADTAFLVGMAEMEDEHERIFAAMKKGLSSEEQEQTAFDPYDESALYLEAMADAHGGEGTPGITESLTGGETMEQILRIGMDLEKQSILFYTGLKDVVPANLGKDKVDDIIAEEKKHLAILSGELKKLKER